VASEAFAGARRKRNKKAEEPAPPPKGLMLTGPRAAARANCGAVRWTDLEGDVAREGGRWNASNAADSWSGGKQLLCSLLRGLHCVFTIGSCP
jgi:hypothetical protein